MITFEEYENALKQRHGERIHNILSHSSVAIAGLGGLGSNIAMYLARAGVGHLHLVDFDKVDITNPEQATVRYSRFGNTENRRTYKEY